MSSNPSVTSASGKQRSDHGPGGGRAGQWARRAMKRALVTAEPLSRRQVGGVVRFRFCGASFQSFYEHFVASSKRQLHRWRGRAIIGLAEAVGFRREEPDPGLDTSSVRSISGTRNAKAVGFNHMRRPINSPSPTSIGISCRLNGRLQNLLNLVSPPGQHHEQRREHEQAHQVQDKRFL